MFMSVKAVKTQFSSAFTAVKD